MSTGRRRGFKQDPLAGHDSPRVEFDTARAASGAKEIRARAAASESIAVGDRVRVVRGIAGAGGTPPSGVVTARNVGAVVVLVVQLDAEFGGLPMRYASDQVELESGAGSGRRTA